MRGSPIRSETFRERKNLLLAQLSELGEPLFRAGVNLSVSRAAGPPESWRQGILLGADHIGDVLYNTASLDVLAAAFPNCRWTFIAEAPAAQALANHPLIGVFASLESAGDADVAICYNSGGYWKELLAAVRRGIPNRVGYVHKGFSALVTKPIRIRYPQSFPAYFRDLVAQLSDRDPDWSLRPRVYPGEEDRAKAAHLWRELAFDDRRPTLACFFTSRQSRGVWPADRFAVTLREIERESDRQTLLLGTESDIPLLANLKQKYQLRATIAAGRLTLLPLVCFLQNCTAVFSTDSGPRHLANAAGVPVAYVRNLSFSKIEAGRYCETELDLAPDVEFVSAQDQAQIFARIKTSQIARQVIELLGRTGRRQ